MTSYSQTDEQAHILSAFGTKSNGRFLDIGAYDGYHFSNTLALVERGWAGVLVEPGLTAFQSLLGRYGSNPKLQLIHAAIGMTPGIAEFWESSDALSTTVPAHKTKWARTAHYQPSFYVPIVSIDALMAFAEDVDFLNIDTEGTSANLFLSFPFNHYRPKVICVEHDNQRMELNERAWLYEYRVLYENAENVIYGY